MLKEIVFTIDHNRPTFLKLIRPHFHDSLEITLCMSNGGTFCVANQLIPVCRGVLILAQSGTDHYCIADQSTFERYSIRIPNHTLESISSLQTDFKPLLEQSNLSTTLTNEQTDHLVSLLDDCLACGSGFGEDIQRIAFFLHIILYIGSVLRFLSHGVNPASSRDYKKIMPAIQYIHENYAEEITVEQLSELCFLSKYYLSHMFRSITGFSIKNYIANYRIRQACILFSQGLSVQDVGSAVGYSNSSYFIQVFKKIVGTTPGNFLYSRQL